MNGEGKSAVFCISVISVALVALIYTVRVDSWNHKVFTFPPETQNVIINGTATMEIQWRWTPETLEIIAKVNDDEANVTIAQTWENHTDHLFFYDSIVFLFDSDNNGKFSSFTTWMTGNDRCVTTQANFAHYVSAVVEHCFLDETGFIREPYVYCDFNPYVITGFNSTYYFKEGEGYTFNLSIPIELIKVTSPTNIMINFNDRWGQEYSKEPLPPVPCTLVAELKV